MSQAPNTGAEEKFQIPIPTKSQIQIPIQKSRPLGFGFWSFLVFGAGELELRHCLRTRPNQV
jgi:hypothetical protein